MAIDTTLASAALSALLTPGGALGGASSSGGLSALLGGGGAGTAGGPDFGPAALLSLGSNTPSVGAGYENLAGTLYAAGLGAGRSGSAPPPGKAEIAAIRKAEALRDEGRLDEAEAALDAYEQQRGASGYTLHARGAIRLEQRDYREAERLFRRAAQLAPGNDFERDADNANVLRKDDAAVLERARRLLAVDDSREDGERLLVSLTARSPANTDARVELAEALLKDGNATQSLFQYGLAVATAEAGQLETIERRLSYLSEQAPKAVFVRQLLGQTQLRLGKSDEALATLQAARELSADDDDTQLKKYQAQAIVQKGRRELTAGNTLEAVRLFEDASGYDALDREVVNGLAAGYIARAELRQRQGALTQAINDYRNAGVRVGATGDRALRERAARGAYAVGVLQERRNLALGEPVGQEAVAFQAAHDIDPDNQTYKARLAAVRNRQGDQYSSDGRYNDAAAAYQRAYDLVRGEQHVQGQRHQRAYRQYGEQQLGQLRYDDAIAALRSAYALDRNDLTSRTALADAYHARGLDHVSRDEKNLAARDFREALTLLPDNATYQASFGAVAAWL